MTDFFFPPKPSIGSSNITDGSIVNADISATAGIVSTKLSAATQTSLGKADTALQSGAGGTSIHAASSALLHASNLGSSAGGSRFLLPVHNAAASATESQGQFSAPFTGKLVALYIDFANQAAATDAVFTFRVQPIAGGGGDTAAVVTILTGARTGNYTGSISFNSGDRLSVKSVTTASSATNIDCHATLVFRED